jgi:hypothetical protein
MKTYTKTQVVSIVKSGELLNYEMKDGNIWCNNEHGKFLSGLELNVHFPATLKELTGTVLSERKDSFERLLKGLDSRGNSRLSRRLYSLAKE